MHAELRAMRHEAAEFLFGMQQIQARTEQPPLMAMTTSFLTMGTPNGVRFGITNIVGVWYEYRRVSVC